MRWIPRLRFRLAFSLVLLVAAVVPVRAQDRLCDPGNENCRSILINYIRNETQAIDVAFWFMEDARYTNELILKWRAGIPVRVLIDPRANTDYPLNAQRLAELQAAGIPMRKRLTSDILHWKMMLFQAQNVVEFSGANYSADAWRPTTATPYENYVDEAIYFTSDTAIVNSFRTKFDDQWIDTAGWTNYANVAGNFISGGISNLYYPDESTGFEKTVIGALTVTAEGVIGSELIEFLPDIQHHFTKNRQPKPQK